MTILKRLLNGYPWHSESQIRIGLAAILLGIILALQPRVSWAYDPHLRFPWPATATHFISSGGYGYNCGDHTGADYYAIDFAFNNGEVVSAVQGGTVTIAHNANDNPYGVYVEITHGNGLISRYAHLQLNSISVGVNSIVIQGQQLALSDNTGNSTGPHLHFHMHLNGGAYMPEPMSTSGSLPLTGLGRYGFCSGISSASWGGAVPVSNVLQNSSFESWPVFSEDGGPWQRASGTNWARYIGGGNGSYYLEMNIGSAGSGASLWQRFAVSDTNWSNYTNPHTFVSTPDTWTVRVWMRTPNCSGITGTLAVWALNGPSQEVGSTGITLDGSWRSFSATTHFTSDGHNRLQVQIYMDSSSSACNYDYDYAIFVRNYDNNTSFEDGAGYWTTYHSQGNCTVNYATYFGNVPDDGKFLEANRGNCTTGVVSIIQDTAAYSAVNDSYTLRVWIRSPGGGAISGTVALWGKGGIDENNSTAWSIGSGDYSWHEITVSLTIRNTGHTSMRTKFYLDQSSPNFDFDGVELFGGAGG